MRRILLAGMVAFLLSGCATVKMPLYRQDFNVTQPVSEVDVRIVPIGQAWNVTIQNKSDNMMKLLIDESTYVNTMGKAERLIRGETRRIVSSLSQPPITIPPRSECEEIFLMESSTSLNEYQLQMPGLPIDPRASAKLYFTFEVSGAKKTWACEIKYTDTGKTYTTLV